MFSTDSLLAQTLSFMPLLVTLLTVAIVLWIANYLLIVKQADAGSEKLFSRQLIMLALTLIALLATVFALPVSESSRNQIIGLIGLVISGIFAFSSSTIFANLLAGIMLRMTKPFKTGDFVQVGDFFGRVVERGLLDTEVQTEVRDLVALPNTFMITNPITVTRTSGTIISTSLSLGYDIHNSKIEPLLIQAATNCELSDPFVHIVELGDFSVTYKISGKLEEVKSLISSRTRLNREVLNVLHENAIEIMSPSFMNQRKIPDEIKIIPPKQQVSNEANNSTVDQVIFDKAEEAEQKEQLLEHLKAQLIELNEQLKLAEDSQKDSLKSQIQDLTQKIKSFNHTEDENNS
ncbi:MAG: mechanosensitive ion channel domain-containing protein [Aliiglaciecola sp.]|uniref:mechanosensitive ion channel family protein n=1 Tax=Aliiglaciecola sp. TaxID=1872441 RepID=UPI003296C29E